MSGLDPLIVVERLVKVEEAVKDIPEIKHTLHELNTKLARYEGRWGAIMVIGTAIWTMFTVFKDDLFSFFHGVK